VETNRTPSSSSGQPKPCRRIMVLVRCRWMEGRK
jgi:hypothetical protein